MFRGTLILSQQDYYAEILKKFEFKLFKKVSQNWNMQFTSKQIFVKRSLRCKVLCTINDTAENISVAIQRKAEVFMSVLTTIVFKILMLDHKVTSKWQWDDRKRMDLALNIWNVHTYKSNWARYFLQADRSNILVESTSLDWDKSLHPLSASENQIHQGLCVLCQQTGRPL